MKAFKKFSSAEKANRGTENPILKAGEFYLVFEAGDDLAPAELSEFAVLRSRNGNKSYAYVGQVTVRHLERLGNANWAEKGEASG